MLSTQTSHLIRIDIENNSATQMLKRRVIAGTLSSALTGSARGLSLIIPDNQLLGGTLARRVYLMRCAKDEEYRPTSRFVQIAKPQRFSIFAAETGSLLRAAGYITLSWSLDLAQDTDPEAGPRDHVLTLRMEALFIDAELRGKDYDIALGSAAYFWLSSLLLDIDREARKRGGRVFPLSIRIGASNAYPSTLTALNDLGNNAQGQIEHLLRGRLLSGIAITGFSTFVED
jgi:hypothetical protein